MFAGADRVKIIDAPQDPKFPITLPRYIFILAGLLAGLGLGIGLSVAAELLDQRLRIAREFGALLNIPVLAKLPVVRSQNALQFG